MRTYGVLNSNFDILSYREFEYNSNPDIFTKSSYKFSIYSCREGV